MAEIGQDGQNLPTRLKLANQAEIGQHSRNLKCFCHDFAMIVTTIVTLTKAIKTDSQLSRKRVKTWPKIMSYNPHFLLAGILFCNISLWMQAAGPTWQTTSEFFSSPPPFLPPHRWCREVMACSSSASPPLSKVLGRPARMPSQYWAFPKNSNPTACLVYHVLA